MSRKHRRPPPPYDITDVRITRLDTRLPKSRAGGQGSDEKGYFKHLGRSSNAERQDTKNAKKDRPTDIAGYRVAKHATKNCD